MIAVDLDDTLLGRDKRMSDINRDAIIRAHDAGVLVLPCTGRTWHKARALALDVLPMLDVGVFFDGSMICHCATGSIRHCTTMHDDAAAGLLDWFDGRDYTLVYCCRTNASHYRYVVTGETLAGRIVDAWLGDAPVEVAVHDVPSPAAVRDTLGVRIVAEGDAAIERAGSALRDRGAADRGLTWHALWFVQGGLSVLQIYDRKVDKWPAVQWVAERHGIEPGDIAFIGDQINDVAALREAGCGIAMSNAVDAAKQAADHVTADCDAHGVAHAIDRLLSGEWG
jgi:HAD superfamily hydrolase (TIGR01484 family)